MNMNMFFQRKLPIPMEVKQMYPISEEVAATVEKRDQELKKIFAGEENKLILVIGPCSADREDAVMEYMHRLKDLYAQVEDKIYIIPRVYTNKPRTTGEGYKGMLHQPDPNEAPDIFKGIVAIRQLHMRVVEETGMTTADEMLYPENHRYLDDLIGYVAVGARSVEDQYHRMTASGIDVPVGMKNPTSGDISVMMNAINAAQVPQDFVYRGWAVHTYGNPYAHAILRGYVNKHGQSQPNYHYEDLLHVTENYKKAGFANPAIIVDCNHSNSDKHYLEQGRILKEVLHSCRHNSEIAQMVKGFMIESYLVDGNQKADCGIYGKSITDPCLGWEKTEQLIKEVYELL